MPPDILKGLLVCKGRFRTRQSAITSPCCSRLRSTRSWLLVHVVILCVTRPRSRRQQEMLREFGESCQRDNYWANCTRLAENKTGGFSEASCACLYVHHLASPFKELPNLATLPAFYISEHQLTLCNFIAEQSATVVWAQSVFPNEQHGTDNFVQAGS